MRTMLSVSARRFLLVMGVMVAAGAVAGCSNKGLSGIGTPCDGPRECTGGKVCAGGMCADPGNGRPGSPCSATRDCSGGNFCDGLTGVCTHGGWPRHRRGVRVRPPVPAAAALQPRRVLRDLRGRGQRRSGRHLHRDRRLSFGPVVRREPRVRRAENAYPPFAGVTCTDEGAFRGLLRGAAARQAAGGLLPPAVPERHPRQRRRARHLRLPQAWSDAARRRPRAAVCRHLDRRLRRLLGSAGITFRFSGHIDYNSATPDAVKMVDVTAGPSFGTEFARAWSSPTTAHEVLVQQHAGRCATRPTPRSARPHLRGDPDDRHQVGHGRGGGRRRRLRRRHAARPGRPATRRSDTRGTPTSRCATGPDEQGQPTRRRARGRRGVHGAGRARAHGRGSPTSVASQPAPDADGAHAVRRRRGLALRRRDGGARVPGRRRRFTRSTASSHRADLSRRAPRRTRRPRRAAASSRTAGMPGAGAHRGRLLRADDPEGRRLPADGLAAGRLPPRHRRLDPLVHLRRCRRRAGAGATPVAVLGFDAVEHGARRGALDEEARRPGVQPAQPARRARQLPAGRRRHPAGAARLDGRAVGGTSPTGAAIVVRSGAPRRSSGTRRAAPRASWRWPGRRRAGGGLLGRRRLPDVVAARQDEPGQHRAPAWRS